MMVNRRAALLGLLGVIVRGFGGNPVQALEANLTIPLDKFPKIRLTCKGDEVWLSGVELFNVIKSTQPPKPSA